MRNRFQQFIKFYVLRFIELKDEAVQLEDRLNKRSRFITGDSLHLQRVTQGQLELRLHLCQMQIA